MRIGLFIKTFHMKGAKGALSLRSDMDDRFGICISGKYFFFCTFQNIFKLDTSLCL